MKIADTIEFGQYKQNDTFKSIKWTVLDIVNDTALIICNKVIDCQPYCKNQEMTNWQQCYLRQWLNKTFYLMAFNKKEQEKIVSVKLDETLDDVGYINPYDKVLLLNVEEAEKYFEYDEDRLAKTTDYAISLGVLGDSFVNYPDWWLKGGEFCDGSYDDEFGGEITNTSITLSCCRGVRPCLWIRINKIN